MMSSEATLRPYTKGLATMYISDASPCGIAASVYQVRTDGTGVPINHISRALTKEEQAWNSQIDWESLGKSWGMNQFRLYLAGQHFTAWGDQKPLIPLYNDMTKTCLVRINKHWQKVQDLSFTDKYMPGKEIPCDYNSRHPNKIDHLSQDERNKLGIGEEDKIMIRRMVHQGSAGRSHTGQDQRGGRDRRDVQKAEGGSAGRTETKRGDSGTLCICVGGAGGGRQHCVQR